MKISLLLLCINPAWTYTAYHECDRFAAGGCAVGHPNYYPGNLRVAVAQVTSNVTTPFEDNVAKHVAWVEKAGKEGARVILFPELSMTGYFADIVVALAGKEGSAAEANRRLRAAEDQVAQAAKANNMYAIIGIPVFYANVTEKNKRPWYNTALVIAPDGTKQYRQAKLYTCCTQDGTAGKWIDIFNITNFDGTVLPVATQVCYDDFHPEIARLQAVAGAQILFFMSWESDASVEWKLELGDNLGSAQSVASHHAAVNQMFVVQSNGGGSVDNMIDNYALGYQGIIMGGSHGQSRVIDPTGVVLEQARMFGQQLLIHDLDLTLLPDPKHRMPLASLNSPVFGSMWRDGLSKFSKMPINWSDPVEEVEAHI